MFTFQNFLLVLFGAFVGQIVSSLFEALSGCDHRIDSEIEKSKRRMDQPVTVPLEKSWDSMQQSILRGEEWGAIENLLKKKQRNRWMRLGVCLLISLVMALGIWALQNDGLADHP